MRRRQWFASAQAKADYTESLRLELLKSTYRLDADGHPELYQSLNEAKARLQSSIRRDVTDWAGLENYFAGSEEEFKGWLRVSWSKPSGAALDAVDTRLKALKLTIRNAPLDQPASFAPCIFTGAPGVQEILIGRAY